MHELTQCLSHYVDPTVFIVTGSFHIFLTLNPQVRNDHVILVNHLDSGLRTQQKDKVRQTIKTCGCF